MPLTGTVPTGILCAGLLAAAGLAAFGRGGAPGGGRVNITPCTFRGWKDAYRLTNGKVELVAVPGIARIMSFGPVGGPNLFWVNDAMTPEATGRQIPVAAPDVWLNFGGDKLWIAPEADWNWPPDPALDRGPCRAAANEKGELVLTGPPSQRHGVRFERTIRLAPDAARVEIEQTMRNVSHGPVSGAIWEVTQVPADCIAFVPLGPGASWRTDEGTELDEQWQRVGEMLILRPNGTEGKVFISGPPAWLGCLQGGILYIKSFSMPSSPTPPTESPREVYTGKLGYIELEVVGPQVTLQPGQETATKETWHLARLDKTPGSDEELVGLIAQKAASLGLR